MSVFRENSLVNLFLITRILAKSGATLQDSLPGADGVSIGEALLAPTVVYVKQVLELVMKGGVKGIAHITGGGFTDNIPRILPSGLGAQLRVGAWNVLPFSSGCRRLETLRKQRCSELSTWASEWFSWLIWPQLMKSLQRKQMQGYWAKWLMVKASPACE